MRSLALCFLTSFTFLTVAALPTKAATNEPNNLFRQSATAGTMTPATLPGFFLLTLQGVDPKIVFFTDNTATVTHTLDFDTFHRTVTVRGDALATGALVLADGPADHNVVLVEFHQTDFDTARQQVTFLVKLLPSSYSDPDLAAFVPRLIAKPPTSFGASSLFWSICHSKVVLCYGQFQGGGSGETCRTGCGGLPGTHSYKWSWTALQCIPNPDLSDQCTQTVCNNTSDFCRRDQCIDWRQCFSQ